MKNPHYSLNTKYSSLSRDSGGLNKCFQVNKVSKSSTPYCLKALTAQDSSNESSMFLKISFIHTSAICYVPPARHGRTHSLETSNLVNQCLEFHSPAFFKNYKTRYCQKALQAVPNPFIQVMFGQTCKADC